MVVGLYLVVYWLRVVCAHHHAASGLDDAQPAATGDDAQAVGHFNHCEREHGLSAASWRVICDGAECQCLGWRHAAAEFPDTCYLLLAGRLVGGLYLGKSSVCMLSHAYSVASGSHDV